MSKYNTGNAKKVDSFYDQTVENKRVNAKRLKRVTRWMEKNNPRTDYPRSMQ